MVEMCTYIHVTEIVFVTHKFLVVWSQNGQCNNVGRGFSSVTVSSLQEDEGER